MAKRKRKISKSKSKTKKRSTPMATRKRRRKKRRSSSTSIIRRTTALSGHRKRRKKRGLLHAQGPIVMHAKHAGAGALGGASLLATRFFTMPTWLRPVIGFGGSLGLSAMNMPFAGAGLAGATAYDLGGSLLSKFGMLHDDGDIEDVEYVDASTLQDTGMIDEDGNAIVMDEDNVAYALNDNGDLEAIGDAYSLSEGTDMQSVSMLPLQDPYALSNSYSLQSSY